MIIEFAIPGEPVPFARAGSHGKRRFTPKKQSDFMAVIKQFASQAMAGRPPIEGPVELCVHATYLYPASWSKKRRESTRWKTSKPDGDNIKKIIKDAMSKIVWVDDAQVASGHVWKTYGDRAEIRIRVSVLMR